MNEFESQRPHDLADLRYFFGRDAHVTVNHDGNWMISNRLRDGLCPGGQRIDIQLMPKTKLANYHVDTGYADPDYFGYPCKELCVNGHVLRTAPIVFVQPEKRMKKIHHNYETLPHDQQSDVTNQFSNRFNRYSYNTYAVMSHTPSFIRLSSLDNADDLAVLFHEQGEVNTGLSVSEHQASYLLEFMRKMKGVRFLHFLIQVGGPTAVQSPQFKNLANMIFERVDMVLNGERSASLDAINQIETVNAEYKIFPTDTGLFRVRKFLQTALLTYRNWHDGYFNSFFNEEQKRQLDAKLEL